MHDTHSDFCLEGGKGSWRLEVGQATKSVCYRDCYSFRYPSIWYVLKYVELFTFFSSNSQLLLLVFHVCLKFCLFLQIFFSCCFHCACLYIVIHLLPSHFLKSSFHSADSHLLKEKPCPAPQKLWLTSIQVLSEVLGFPL